MLEFFPGSHAGCLSRKLCNFWLQMLAAWSKKLADWHLVVARGHENFCWATKFSGLWPGWATNIACAYLNRVVRRFLKVTVPRQVHVW